MKQLWQRIRSVTLKQWAYLLGGIVVLLAIFLGVAYVWDYTNSSPFCGTYCHTMPPHYQSFLRSPHARVQCVECHIGRTFVGVAFTRKATDLQYVINYLSNNYKFPIFAKEVQPARESCEKCHWPEKFSWDKVITLTSYAPDAKNSLTRTLLMMKIGGGTQRAGLGRGIHWHVENVIDFAYTDEQKEDIPYIQVTTNDGKKITYTDIESKLTAEQIAKLPTRRMDCIDCHNRVSHNFLSPTEALDSALETKQIDAAIPEIKKKGVEALTPTYASKEAANKAIAELEQFYKQTYADFYAKNTATVQKAISQLQTWYTQLHFPEQGLDWTVHTNDIGHKDWPGCFRCHDGKHFTTDRKEAIRLECNICHTIPEVITTGTVAPMIALSRGDEPASHKTTTWLAEHRAVFNTSCQTCHDTNNAGGKDNSSFCSNSACHGATWKYAGLNAPALAEMLKEPVRPKSDPNAPPKAIPHPIGGNPDCQICHGAKSRVRPYPSDHAGRTNTTCQSCHKPIVPAASATPAPGTTTGGPPAIPHETAGRTQCLGCHGSGASGTPQITQFHKDFGLKNDQCLTCHKTKTGTSAPSASTTPTASGGIKTQPADHAGRTQCAICHTNNIGPKLPADHTGRADNTCNACHKVR